VFFMASDTIYRQTVKNTSTLSSPFWTISHVVGLFSETLIALKKYTIPLPLIQTLMSSLASTLNRFIFNTFFQHPNLCKSETGIQIKQGISEIEQWIENKPNKVFCGNAIQNLSPTKEASTLLTLDKSILTDRDIITAIAPSLNYHQIKTLLLNFKPQSQETPLPSASINLLDKLSSQDFKTPVLELERESPNKLDLSFIEQSLKSHY